MANLTCERKDVLSPLELRKLTGASNHLKRKISLLVMFGRALRQKEVLNIRIKDIENIHYDKEMLENLEKRSIFTAENQQKIEEIVMERLERMEKKTK